MIISRQNKYSNIYLYKIGIYTLILLLLISSSGCEDNPKKSINYKIKVSTIPSSLPKPVSTINSSKIYQLKQNPFNSNNNTSEDEPVGGWTGGGGPGVLCKKSNSILPLEIYEDLFSGEVIYPSYDDTVESFIFSKILKPYLKNKDSLLTHKLKYFLSITEPQSWIPKKNLNLLSDQGYLSEKIKDKNGDCTLVQLLIREAPTSLNSYTSEQPLKLTIYKNQQLFDIIDTYEKPLKTLIYSVLWFHEALYFMGYITNNHSNSEKTRIITANIFKKNFYNDTFNNLQSWKNSELDVIFDVFRRQKHIWHFKPKQTEPPFALLEMFMLDNHYHKKVDYKLWRHLVMNTTVYLNKNNILKQEEEYYEYLKNIRELKGFYNLYLNTKKEYSSDFYLNEVLEYLGFDNYLSLYIKKSKEQTPSTLTNKQYANEINSNNSNIIENNYLLEDLSEYKKTYNSLLKNIFLDKFPDMNILDINLESIYKAISLESLFSENSFFSFIYQSQFANLDLKTIKPLEQFYLKFKLDSESSNLEISPINNNLDVMCRHFVNTIYKKQTYGYTQWTKNNYIENYTGSNLSFGELISLLHMHRNLGYCLSKIKLTRDDSELSHFINHLSQQLNEEGSSSQKLNGDILSESIDLKFKIKKNSLFTDYKIPQSYTSLDTNHEKTLYEEQYQYLIENQNDAIKILYYLKQLIFSPSTRPEICLKVNDEEFMEIFYEISLTFLHVYYEAHNLICDNKINVKLLQINDLYLRFFPSINLFNVDERAESPIINNINDEFKKTGQFPTLNNYYFLKAQ